MATPEQLITLIYISMVVGAMAFVLLILIVSLEFLFKIDW